MSNKEVFFLAEAGVNHNGEKEKAFALVEVAAAAGADAVKFQTFNAEKLAASRAPKAAYQKKLTDHQESQLEMLRKLELPLDWHAPLKEHAESLGIQFLSTAFDVDSLQFLQTLDLPVYKIPSGEIVNAPLLWHFARTGKPLILSTGMATLGEIEQALAVLSYGMSYTEPPKNFSEIWSFWSSEKAQQQVRDKITLLHCTSQYPTPMEEVNLNAMNTLADAFGMKVGYSDHTEGNLIAIAAVAKGAVLIEKHFTLDRQLPGPDHAASLEPTELKHLISQIRALSIALGSGIKAPQPSEWDTRRAARQNIIASRDIAVGELFSVDNITTARAGGGRSPMEWWDVLQGEPAKKNMMAGDPI